MDIRTKIYHLSFLKESYQIHIHLTSPVFDNEAALT